MPTLFELVVAAVSAFVLLAVLRLPVWLALAAAAGIAVAVPAEAGAVGWLTFVGALLVAPWWLGPLSLLRTQRVRLRPDVEPYDPARHPELADLGEEIAQAAAALEADGFTRLGDFRCADPAAKIVGRAILLYEAGRGELALAGAMKSSIVPTERGVWLDVGIESGEAHRAFVTNNPRPSPFSRVPWETMEVLPSVRDGARLLRIFRAWRARAGVEPTAAPAAAFADPVALVQRLSERQHREQMALGLLRLASDGGAGTPPELRPTLRGAVLMCWRLLPPWITLTRRRRARRERELLAELEPIGRASPAEPVRAI